MSYLSCENVQINVHCVIQAVVTLKQFHIYIFIFPYQKSVSHDIFFLFISIAKISHTATNDMVVCNFI